MFAVVVQYSSRRSDDQSALPAGISGAGAELVRERQVQECGTGPLSDIRRLFGGLALTSILQEERSVSDEPKAEVGIRPWSEGNVPLFERLTGDPAMTEHFGGPETPEKIRERSGLLCILVRCADDPVPMPPTSPSASTSGRLTVDGPGAGRRVPGHAAGPNHK